MKKKLAFLLPTNDPKTFKEVFFRTVENLIPCKDLILFSINFQRPFTKNKAKRIVKKLEKIGFEVRWTFNEYRVESKGLIPFNQIRRDCAELCPDIEIFGLCDDDFFFCKNIHLMIDDILKVFDKNPELGIIQCSNETFKLIRYREVNSRYHTYFTDQGFFFRNIHHLDNNVLVYPEEALNVYGAGEELIIGLELASRGYRVIVRTYSEIEHLRNLTPIGSPQGWDSKEITCGEKGVKPFIDSYYKEFLKKNSLAIRHLEEL